MTSNNALCDMSLDQQYEVTGGDGEFNLGLMMGLAALAGLGAPGFILFATVYGVGWLIQEWGLQGD